MDGGRMDHKYNFVAKAIVAVCLGALVGYFLMQNMNADVEKGRTLTMDAYMQDFPKYKAKLESHTSGAGAVIVMVFLAVGFFGIYEFLSLLLARLIALVIGSASTEPRSSVP